MTDGESPVLRIVSGGQTGVDRAALDVALEFGMPCGGWVPKGRRAEDGRIADRYPLQESPNAAYAERTRWNVRDSDATLILCRGRPSGGTALTISIAEAMRRPFRIVDLDGPDDTEATRLWIADSAARTLNVAGPRESSTPGIHEAAVAFLTAVLT